ncbi:MAG: hypothetical protein JWO80_3346 [Bryobacterales bacterium]|nr:hypothetical protein [Bryobacterales bacterium]
MACLLGVIPALIFAHSFGPDAGYTGAPGDDRAACTSCHVGTTLNSGGGSVAIKTVSSTYTPGVAQEISVTIADAAERSWGFELTARLASEATQTKNFTQPGDFAPEDALTQVICGDNSPKQAGKACNSSFPIQYIEHTLAGNVASTGPNSYTFKFKWTPPATDVGNIVLYAAGNASRGLRNANDGHIYTSNITLTPAAGGPAPSISSGGVVNGATFAATPVGPNTYLTIQGANLAVNTRQWAGSDFGSGGNQLPTSLDGTSVTVNGKPAYVEFISPGQINVITPADSATGSGIPVVVTTNGQSSTAATVTYQSIAPSLFAFAPGTADNNKYPAAGHQNGTFVGKAGLFPSAPSITTPAQRNETITLYGTGFGTTNPALAAGLVTPASPFYPLSTSPVITIGGVSATAVFAGLAPNFAQVYQFNVTIPNVPDGDQPLVIQTGGLTTQPLSITVQGAQ